ncbi:MAG: 16S rRNA (adenine(1518)-N(6)/adenine(1519)-N(6))-dimethyltransferase RsmA [Ectothiorhodospiraceae bacterium]|jgi:16S rRNA (adenine1518-N6/adenine1519-N6)-dimethyltransferase
MDHRPRRRFGQNFLHDPGVISRMIAAIDPRPGQHMVEIGPGLGALTEPLLERLGELTAIELDRDLAAQLRHSGNGRLQVLEQDALGTDFAALRSDERPLRIVGNLPYNISTPLLFNVASAGAAVADMHFLLQKEVVDRMAATPGGGDYGRLSVMLQFHCRVQPLFDVGPGAFRPAPKVTSTFVRLLPHATPPVFVADQQALATVVTRAFSQRRKTLRNSLRKLLDTDRIEATGVDPGSRAETLDLAAFARLANAVARRG